MKKIFWYVSFLICVFLILFLLSKTSNAEKVVIIPLIESCPTELQWSNTTPTKADNYFWRIQNATWASFVYYDPTNPIYLPDGVEFAGPIVLPVNINTIVTMEMCGVDVNATIPWEEIYTVNADIKANCQ